uniref:Uncharacterized protein n=1 Tax=Anguilla anguilla TaxID=7936 RepID=A0A0E9Q1D8_ANGAN
MSNCTELNIYKKNLKVNFSLKPNCRCINSAAVNLT